MPDVGPERTVKDDRILLEFVLKPGPAFFTSEFEDDIDLTPQQIRNRLSALEEEGFVTSKKASGRRLWWITDAGRERVSATARELFESY